MNWTLLAQNWVQGLSLVNMVLNLRVPWKLDFLISCSNKTSHCAVSCDFWLAE
jgi:hypothetical protein